MLLLFCNGVGCYGVCIGNYGVSVNGNGVLFTNGGSGLVTT